MQGVTIMVPSPFLIGRNEIEKTIEIAHQRHSVGYIYKWWKRLVKVAQKDRKESL